MKNALLILLALTTLSCENSQDEICQVILPEFFAGFEVTEKRLPQEVAKELERKLASAPEIDEKSPSESVEYFQSWAEESLKTIQSFQDFTETDPKWLSYHRDLTKIANELVLFYSYSEGLKYQKMQSALKKAGERLKGLREGICSEMPSSRNSGETPRT